MLTPPSGDSIRINDILAALQNGVVAINNFSNAVSGSIASTTISVSSINSSQLVPNTGSSGQLFYIQSGNTPTWTSSADFPGPLTVQSALTASSNATVSNNLTVSASATVNSLGVSSRATIGTSLFLSAYGEGLLHVDNTHAVYSDGIGCVAPGHDSVVGNGVTDDSAAIFSLIGSFNEVVIAPGSYKLSVSKTIGAGKRITFTAGAEFIFGSGVTWDFSGSEVIASLGTQCFSAPNNNNVKGLINSTPEMFGAKRDGSTDDSGAITAAINATVLAPANSMLGYPTCQLSRGTYLVSNQISITLPAAGSCRTVGAGDWGDQTILLGSTTLSGTCLLFTSNTANGSVNLKLLDFVIKNKVKAVGATQGLYIGTNSTSLGLLNPSEQPGSVLLDHMFVTGFATNYVIQNIGGVTFQYSQSWGFDNSGNNTTSGTGILATTAGNVGGTQIDAHDCIINGDNSAGWTGISLSDASGGSVTGCRFLNNVIYNGTGGGTSMSMSATHSGGLIFDIWVEDGNQFESQQVGGSGNPAINMNAANGGIVQDIHLNHIYFSGQGWNTAVNGLINDTTSVLRNVWVTNDFFVPSGHGNAILFTGSSGAPDNMQGIVCGNNIFYCGSSLNSLGGFQYGKDVTITGNVGTYTSTALAANTGFTLFNTGKNAAAVGNVTGSTTPVFTSWTNTAIANNI